MAGSEEATVAGKVEQARRVSAEVRSVSLDFLRGGFRSLELTESEMGALSGGSGRVMKVVV